MLRSKCFSIVLLVALAGANLLPGATIVFDATDSGWYRSAGGFHNPANENFFVGSDPGSEAEFRDFFVFDLSSQPVLRNVLAVTLRVQNVPLDNTAPSPQGGETYTAFEVLSPAAVVTAGGGGAVFADLGDGTAFGSLAGLSADVAQTIALGFNAGGVGAVSTALLTPGLFVIGGRIVSIDDLTFSTDGEDFFEGPDSLDVGPTTRQLVIQTDALVVPEPSTILLMGAGLLGLAALARRRLGQVSHPAVRASRPRSPT
jgi:hypothetical protein